LRIARVIHGTSPLPVLALERDGAVYDVGELDRIFGTSLSPDRVAGASEFYTRAIAMGGAGLDALDERLRSGDRPSAARLLPGTFLPLPPCDTDRALYVQMAPYDAETAVPLHRLGDARGLLGHGALVPFPSSATSATYELGLAAVLGDDLASADPTEAERAVLGYTLLNAWSAPDPDPLPGWSATRVPAQLGPVLVTRDEIADLGRLKAHVRVDAETTPTSVGGWTFSLVASISAVSRWIDLRAGDVIGAGCVRGGRGEAPFGAAVDLLVERLGKLSGRPVRRAG
jgi:Fumarylacetoacetate (FAA) hydrolase family